jgi:hypothetical protein
MKQPPSRNGLQRLVTELRTFDPNLEYYGLTLLDDDGRFSRSCISHFVGAGRRSPEWEVRAPSIVHAANLAELWDCLGQGWIAVHSKVHQFT